jgi:hypothetical protein
MSTHMHYVTDAALALRHPTDGTRFSGKTRPRFQGWRAELVQGDRHRRGVAMGDVLRFERLGLNRFGLRGALRPDQLGPDAVPRFLAQMPALQFPLQGGFDAPSFGWPHLTPPSQALVQVLLVHAGCCGESASVSNGKVVAHGNHLSGTLEEVQAERYGVTRTPVLEPAIMETSAQRRRRKLDKLCQDKGGYKAVAKKAHLNPASLDQILKGVMGEPRKDGTRKERGLGDAATHAIEDAYGLGRGWFDSPEMAEAKPASDPVSADHRVLISMLTAEELAYMQALAVALLVHRQPSLAVVLEQIGVTDRTDAGMVAMHLASLRAAPARHPRGGHLGGVDTGIGGLSDEDSGKVSGGVR